MSRLLRRPARVAPDGQDWHFFSFEATRLEPGEQRDGGSDGQETALIVLAGLAHIEVGGHRFDGVGGRSSVWERRPPALVLVPPGAGYALCADSAVELVVASAAAHDSTRPPRVIRAEDMLVERRGEGQTLRYIHHLLPPSAEAERLILVEVYTPGGNWSSFPPHKHDTEDPPRESYLEETYYFHIDPPGGFALERVYTLDSSLDETIAARDGDLVLVPRGYHVVAATPGHECYYLNVMAGPSRVWNFSLDPAYAALMNWQKPAAIETRS